MTIKIGIVAAEFYPEITDQMLDIAMHTAKNEGSAVKKVIRVPGSFDVPLAVKKLLEDDEIAGVITLGAIIKGKTDHDQVIGNATAKTLQELSLQFNKPVVLGINGPGMTRQDALARIPRAEHVTKALISLIDTLREEGS
ncbi:6,7-dimethyl-8-ribityllumazine synthase [Candidatus Woesearchaeota archaeon]|nr:MAG: 6,7-dimethyl-8-ribityllumazine synthase [archaeon GW2011_AR4]MBS3129498.1 6,7-dimethyl-8-ribityllumazine synthase [Candidatus Woesearchaeota archaeon]HIH38879.1 6,7-dimethyl-8-ribityllumazine synthase [Candidatus Woesearchaeota archaeon]HIH48699.1 6,7-dimethyl-8-ribityllumazine synthase [Candidatus Woesearchaeota archaeon]HIJ03785.1 6,7-dimethyl-8-ribityllumazine synthase [Candidatus Woesearchaeota archaeon]